MDSVTQVCEIIMLCVFGASWPFNIAKSLKSKTAKGKSVIFEFLIILGYCFGLFGKLWVYWQTGSLSFATWFYLADILMVSIDVVLYFRNTRLDRLRDREVCAGEIKVR